jgi:hypothetical protein
VYACFLTERNIGYGKAIVKYGSKANSVPLVLSGVRMEESTQYRLACFEAS